MIEIQHLHKRFGDVTAVNGLSFTAPDATITGVLGANGAGKTTTLGIITGLLDPDSGTVSIDRTASNGRDRRSVIGALLDHQGLYPRLTARENIAYFGELQDLSGPALGRRVTELVSALGLDGLADRRVEGFSRGERLKVALGRALVHAPQHLVLDEPTNGLDVASVHGVYSGGCVKKGGVLCSRATCSTRWQPSATTSSSWLRAGWSRAAASRRSAPWLGRPRSRRLS